MRATFTNDDISHYIQKWGMIEDWFKKDIPLNEEIYEGEVFTTLIKDLVKESGWTYEKIIDNFVFKSKEKVALKLKGIMHNMIWKPKKIRMILMRLEYFTANVQFKTGDNLISDGQTITVEVFDKIIYIRNQIAHSYKKLMQVDGSSWEIAKKGIDDFLKIIDVETELPDFVPVRLTEDMDFGPGLKIESE